MSKKNNRTCICCGKEYYFCNTCADQIKEPRWKTIYCSDNCRKIFMTITDYNYKEITKEQAIKNLNACNLNGKYKTSIANAIKILVGSNKPAKQTDIEKESAGSKKAATTQKTKTQTKA